MIVESFKNIAQDLGWLFNYGDESFQNLQDFTDDTESQDQQVLFLLLWKDREKHFNSHNVLTGNTFEGEFILAVRSKLDDQDYNEKYEKRIKAVESKANVIDLQISSCDGWEIKYWKETEVSNALDTNIDGLKIRFRIYHEL